MPANDSPAFISYSRDDSEFVLRLAEDLKAAGASVWLDQLDIEAGQEWDSAIESALIQSPRMLLILSPSSAKSSSVRNEISFALDEKKIIIPVLYQDCAVPLQLRRVQHVDFRADYARGLRALLKSLGVQPSQQPGIPEPTNESKAAHPNSAADELQEQPKRRQQGEHGSTEAEEALGPPADADEAANWRPKPQNDDPRSKQAPAPIVMRQVLLGKWSALEIVVGCFGLAILVALCWAWFR